MNQSKKKLQQRPFEHFRQQAWQCLQMLIRCEESLHSLSLKLVECDLITLEMCNETIAHLDTRQEILQKLLECIYETSQLAIVLPLGDSLATDLRYDLSLIKNAEQDLVAYRSVRRTSLQKKANLQQTLQQHIHMLLFSHEGLVQKVKLCLHQSYFREKAMLDVRPAHIKVQTPGIIISLRPSLS